MFVCLFILQLRLKSIWLLPLLITIIVNNLIIRDIQLFNSKINQENITVMHYDVKLFSLFVPVSVVLLHEEVVRLQEEVSVLKQVREMLNRELEETGGGCSVELLSVSQLRVQLTQKEQELDRAKEALQGRKWILWAWPFTLSSQPALDLSFWNKQQTYKPKPLAQWKQIWC